MTKRVKDNLLFGISGAAYIFVGATAHFNRFICGALIIAGVCSVGAVLMNLMTPQGAEDLHIKP